MDGIKILRVRDGSRFDEKANLIPTKIVEYMIGDHGPFNYIRDQKDWSFETARKDIEHEATELEKFTKGR